MGRDFCRPLNPTPQCLNRNCSNIVFKNRLTGTHELFCEPCQKESDRDILSRRPKTNDGTKKTNKEKYEKKLKTNPKKLNINK